MSSRIPYYVILFKSVSYALKAEKILKAKGIAHKLIPVPKEISSDCGVCLRFEENLQDQIKAALTNNVQMEEIRSICNSFERPHETFT
jgi:hypothetical protein